MPKSDFDLVVGSGAPGIQIGEMLKRLQIIIDKSKNRFDAFLVYGDTNSTFAGALCASKSGIKVAHVEAGVRSFDNRMPEEVNRILTDNLSDLMFAPTVTAVNNLLREHVRGRVVNTGDVSVEILNRACQLLPRSSILDKYELQPREYNLMTLHRAENTNSKDSMISFIRALEIISHKTDNLIVFPIHPRTANFLKRVNLYSRLKKCKSVKIIEPVGYIDFIALMKNARKILTDSGGIQKESYLLEVPCITLRKNTEWVETVERGANILTDTNTNKIVKAVIEWMPTSRAFKKKRIFGEGKTSQKIIQLLVELIQQ